MVGQEVGIYGVFIGIDNEPCITLPSSLTIMNTSGHFNFELLLFLHKAVPLRLILNSIEQEEKDGDNQQFPPHMFSYQDINHLFLRLTT